MKDSTGPTLAGVSIKLPPFWSADPEIWFVQVEAQFTTKGIVAQKMRYDYVVSSLTPEFAMEVHDLLLNPPADNPYDTLKAQLVKRTTASEQRKGACPNYFWKINVIVTLRAGPLLPPLLTSWILLAITF